MTNLTWQAKVSHENPFPNMQALTNVMVLNYKDGKKLDTTPFVSSKIDNMQQPAGFLLLMNNNIDVLWQKKLDPKARASEYRQCSRTIQRKDKL